MMGILNGTSSFNIFHAVWKVVSQITPRHDRNGLLVISVWYLRQT